MLHLLHRFEQMRASTAFDETAGMSNKSFDKFDLFGRSEIGLSRLFSVAPMMDWKRAVFNK